MAPHSKVRFKSWRKALEAPRNGCIVNSSYGRFENLLNPYHDHPYDLAIRNYIENNVHGNQCHDLIRLNYGYVMTSSGSRSCWLQCLETTPNQSRRSECFLTCFRTFLLSWIGHQTHLGGIGICAVLTPVAVGVCFALEVGLMINFTLLYVMIDGYNNRHRDLDLWFFIWDLSDLAVWVVIGIG